MISATESETALAIGPGVLTRPRPGRPTIFMESRGLRLGQSLKDKGEEGKFCTSSPEKLEPPLHRLCIPSLKDSVNS
jgi:hypothetical protein